MLGESLFWNFHAYYGLLVAGYCKNDFTGFGYRLKHTFEDIRSVLTRNGVHVVLVSTLFLYYNLR